MARGDLVVFNETKAWVGWLSTDTVKCAIITNAVNPTAATVTPSLNDFTEVATTGTYVAGGTSLGTWGALITRVGVTTTFDSATNPTWGQHASNGTNAYWGIVYNDTSATNEAFCYVDLAGPVDMTAGPLTITWNVSGLATLT